MKDGKNTIIGFIPKYAVIPLISSFVFNTLVYSGTMKLCSGFYHHDFTTGFDRMVPLIPEFTSIYLICYIFWVINYILIGRIGKEHMYRFLVGDFISRFICGLFFVFLPTTLVRPEVTGTGFWDYVLRFVYKVDQSANLFPSIHCLVSWFCYVGIRNQKEIPKWYRKFSAFFAILVCVSTQVIKQHYIIDLIGGIFLAELCFAIGQKTDWYQGLWKFFTKVNQFFGFESNEDESGELSELKG
ncbi:MULTISPECIES: phosphatase PAP2 family protein [Anaerostipes]|uniref:phosphatase PAP2 family protein n=1 Tax=Anaerostipes TaxID=207244 RepID=UPI001C1E50F0|nr:MULTISPECIES: phosphatase PAP2 family protein [Anaerostipes]MCI5622814.1 phosphatase PAP2 family protein [Anaerostipes sp.]MDY2727125.1 phosphatase PAP2 family protein [Anaerostipes faecalis]